MFNNTQADKVPKDLGLNYYWTDHIHGANFIVVEDTIEYSPHSCVIRILDDDGKVDKTISGDTTRKFKELCTELARNKLNK